MVIFKALITFNFLIKYSGISLFHDFVLAVFSLGLVREKLESSLLTRSEFIMSRPTSQGSHNEYKKPSAILSVPFNIMANIIQHRPLPTLRINPKTKNFPHCELMNTMPRTSES